MNAQKFVISTLIGGVAAMILGFLFYGMLLESFLGQHSTMPMLEEPDMVWMLVGHLFVGAFLTYVIGSLGNIRTFAGGAKAGLIVGLLMSLAWNIIWMSVGDNIFDLTYVLTDSVTGAIMTAIVSGIIAAFLGRGNS